MAMYRRHCVQSAQGKGAAVEAGRRPPIRWGLMGEDAMAAWVMVICGCFIAILGALTLNGWRAAQYRNPLVAGGGALAIGGGLAIDGLPKLFGWSSGVGLAVATVGLVLVVLGSAAQLYGRPGARGRRMESSRCGRR